MKASGWHSKTTSGNNIMNILKLSYHHLWSPLKNCFAYRALFPKDFRMDKETLISLWMAEGFIVPSYESRSLEEAGEEYFMTLLQRCFFQDITRDELGNIAKCKIHDLMHDLAQEVAGADCALTNSAELDIDKRAHHLSFGYCLESSSEFCGSLLKLKNLRTFLLPVQWQDATEFSRSSCNQIISSFECLRVLDLHNLGIESLPSSIGKLVHLRYLDLSHLPIKELPVSITNLQNLETLKLIDCYKLTKLPMNMKKLINLRHLDVTGCFNLTHMPSGMGTLTALHKLSSFIVGIRSSSASNFKSHTAQLSDLNALNNLRGKLCITVFGELVDPVSEAREANLGSKFGISELHIDWDLQNYHNSINQKHDETLLDGLLPHPNLRKLKISSHRGERLPNWASMDDLSSSLPKLVELELSNCGWCQYLPSFSQLPFLKRLCLTSLNSVMYMESGCCKPTSSLSSAAALFFPSLEKLTLDYMVSLKGWWKDAPATTSKDHRTVSSMEAIEQWQKHLPWPSFPKLSELSIKICPNLMAMPLCPNVRVLKLLKVNENFSVRTMMVNPVSFSAADLPSSSTSYSLALSKLDSLCVDNVDNLINLPLECLQNLTSLDLRDHNLLNLSTLGDVFRSLSCLKSLNIIGCHRLRSLSGGLEYLTSLKELDIRNCEELDLSADGMPGDGMPWKALKSLQSLHFHMIPKMSVLPDGLQHVTTLRSLFISDNDELTTIPEWISSMTSLELIYLFDCPRLTSLPEGIRFLASLKRLKISGCQGLIDRCRGPRGDDWPKIQHIPVVSVRLTSWD
ncbi:hypothetical protein Nepgr_026486 [Nepenthes gracilis]|uniref:Disease resistance RPP13-like protein 1 n=1 Tax=Nepenthes gracilis TaxID=150966 RepID=A0AAD3Y0L4_NEPGR|nr:hypothetical protein Nepgr_026486 [Nepenthes gracilis]